MAQRISAWSGWIAFAAVMLMMIGIFNVLEGLAALLQNTVSYVDEGRLVVIDLTAWGVLALAFGAALVAVGLGLLTRSEVARVIAVVMVGLHALVQVVGLAAYPLWSLLMIALDVVVLFALTVHWSPAETSPAGYAAGGYPAGRAEPSSPGR
jgi:hypothetical protein